MNISFFRLLYLVNEMKELHHKDISNIKTESEMTILSVKYDLEDQFKTQKVGCCSFVSQKYFAYFLFATI